MIGRTAATFGIKPEWLVADAAYDGMISYFSRVADCLSRPFKSRCCPRTPSRNITRHIYESAGDVARAVAKTAPSEQTRRDRKKVEMLFTHLKLILRVGRLRLRRPARAQYEFKLAGIAQNLRRKSQRSVCASIIGAFGLSHPLQKRP